jgi:hypothetical protein
MRVMRVVRVVRAKGTKGAEGNKKDLGTRLKPCGFRYASSLLFCYGSTLSHLLDCPLGWYIQPSFLSALLLYETIFALSSDLAANSRQFRCSVWLPLQSSGRLPGTYLGAQGELYGLKWVVSRRI